jgi:hypothetical protein
VDDAAPNPESRSRQRAAFTSFLERDALRERRRRSSRRTVIVSIVIHTVALGALVFYSFWRVDELWSPSVKVKLFAPGQTPPDNRSGP